MFLPCSHLAEMGLPGSAQIYGTNGTSKYHAPDACPSSALDAWYALGSCCEPMISAILDSAWHALDIGLSVVIAAVLLLGLLWWELRDLGETRAGKGEPRD